MEETVTFMDEDPFPGSGLRAVELSDQATLDAYFKSLSEPLSDYTFSQLYTWRDSLRTRWKLIEGHLCVFANGTGDLTLLMPPIGDGDSDRALRLAYELIDDYNASHGVPDRSRVEYASDELLKRFDRSKLSLQPLGTDYIYDTDRMIDLAGGDLASKRQARNRFMRNYAYRIEAYDKSRHFDECCALLGLWKNHQDTQHVQDASASGLKRQKESLACELTLQSAAELGLRGMVMYVKDPQTESADFAIRGFTFGEWLGRDQSSIVIEKTDLNVKGLAQFIFCEFCRREWSERPLVNVGDDWGLESLAWTKMSYRPVKLLQKYILRKMPITHVSLGGGEGEQRASAPAVEVVRVPAVVRNARKEDVAAAVELEQTCFDVHSLSKRQLQYLQQRSSAVFLVAEHQGGVVGEGISLVRRHKTRAGRAASPTGRIYSLAVKHECRCQKIGEQILLALIHGLSERGVRRIYLEVEQSNASAIRLYQRHGFRSIGSLPNYYGQGKDALHMMCQIPLTPTLFDDAVAMA